MQVFPSFLSSSGKIFVYSRFERMMLVKLCFFNPENDLALADGNSNYCPPPAARAIAHDLASLPLWYAREGECVYLPDECHLEYWSSVRGLFGVAAPLAQKELKRVDGCVPWGWSAQVRRRLRDMGVDADVLPSDAFIDDVRRLSNRRCSVGLLRALSAAGIDCPEIPLYLESPEEVAAFIESVPRSVIKAPWSGSGKGIAWGIGRVEVPVEHFYNGVIRRQGGVVCERFLDKVVDFAMEFSVDAAGVAFAGYSLFECAGGAYSGNILAADGAIEDFLAGFVGRDVLRAVRERLLVELARLLLPVGYEGYLGVDMLLYRNGDGYRLHPCVELNLRMNMGAVSRIFYDRFVAGGRVGRYFVSNFRKSGEALALHEKYLKEFPLVVCDGRVAAGYLNLSPVTADSRYVAYVLVCEKNFTLEQLCRGD